MIKNKKKKTFIYEGLGFPIRLIDAPLKKIYGEWAFDFSMGLFQKAVLHMLAMKPSSLTGQELRFVIDYFETSYRDFARIFGVSHVAVVKWEKGKAKMNPSTEVYLRLYILNHLNVSNEEFRKCYLQMRPECLASMDDGKSPLEINADKIAC